MDEDWKDHLERIKEYQSGDRITEIRTLTTKNENLFFGLPLWDAKQSGDHLGDFEEDRDLESKNQEDSDISTLYLRWRVVAENLVKMDGRLSMTWKEYATVHEETMKFSDIPEYHEGDKKYGFLVSEGFIPCLRRGNFGWNQGIYVHFNEGFNGEDKDFDIEIFKEKLTRGLNSTNLTAHARKTYRGRPLTFVIPYPNTARLIRVALFCFEDRTLNQGIYSRKKKLRIPLKVTLPSEEFWVREILPSAVQFMKT
ncbi:hypothetical protein HYFRA_00003963 [Hymenoscyphus fraxineus]|uniref:Uncharacterized protein n=1 Tax=Hymenoscyphus fraxineus TaxID=746836 RepID=A0A9N9KZY3_9HELO|nr:hypothetical protein HYFRA_00003963 [Hymenoscyphus fraxineus]